MTPRASQLQKHLATALLVTPVLLLTAFDLESFAGEAATQKPATQPNWAFRPVTRPAIPTPRNAASSTNAIDRFLLAKLEERGLSPAPPAEPRALARRLHFILTGLPTSDEETEAFVRAVSLSHSPTFSPADGAGEKVGKRESEQTVIAHAVDRLLASPHFGERFARHWQDVVRYADTHGTEHDAFLPHAWRYRDYLIRAFNDDFPYDQFVREHIAGDLLEKPRWAGGLNESLLATAWWRLVEFNQTPVDVKGEEVIVVDSQIDAMSKAFLGLPGFVVLNGGMMPLGGVANWSSGFLPARFEATQFNLTGGAVETAIRNCELAAAMQTAVPEATDLRSESAATHQLYGTDSADPLKARYARQCLQARRLVERGVRFVEVSAVNGIRFVAPWDQHGSLKKDHERNANVVDRPSRRC